VPTGHYSLRRHAPCPEKAQRPRVISRLNKLVCRTLGDVEIEHVRDPSRHPRSTMDLAKRTYTWVSTYP
jgi:hypothetical protein